MVVKQPISSYSCATIKSAHTKAIVLPDLNDNVKATEIKGYIYNAYLILVGKHQKALMIMNVNS